jgi:hypothetical protein
MRRFAPVVALGIAGLLAAEGAACRVYDESLLIAGTDAGPDACSATCGAKCVDLATDPANCGQCGKTCPGACVAGACAAEVLLSARSAPHAIAVDATQIFFAEYNAVQVVAADKTGANPQTISGQAIYADALVIDANYAYWTTNNDIVGAIGATFKNGTGSAQIARNVPSPAAIAIDGNANVFFGTGPTNKAPGCAVSDYANRVMKCPITGCIVTGCPTSGGPSTVLTDSAPITGITIAGTTLFVVSRTGKAIKECALPACSGITSYTGAIGGPTDVAVTADSIYVTDADAGAILRCDRNTHACTAIATGLDQPWRVAAFATDLYFTAYAKGAKDAGGLYRCALPACGGGPKKLAAATGAWGLAVDTTHAYFTEEGSAGGTSVDGRVLRVARQ